tara:strand:+ start:613 stop:867 length:255 start_codon:yes stop_codon:yes gene_type:complete
MYNKNYREIPNIEGITQTCSVGRLELVSLASGIARHRKISATDALFLLESGEITVEQAQELLIQKFQTKQIKTDTQKDDTPTQS